MHGPVLIGNLASILNQISLSTILARNFSLVLNLTGTKFFWFSNHSAVVLQRVLVVLLDLISWMLDLIPYAWILDKDSDALISLINNVWLGMVFWNIRTWSSILTPLDPFSICICWIQDRSLIFLNRCILDNFLILENESWLTLYLLMLKILTLLISFCVINEFTMKIIVKLIQVVLNCQSWFLLSVSNEFWGCLCPSLFKKLISQSIWQILTLICLFNRVLLMHIPRLTSQMLELHLIFIIKSPENL